jgi:hypothetical protein
MARCYVAALLAWAWGLRGSPRIWLDATAALEERDAGELVVLVALAYAGDERVERAAFVRSLPHEAAEPGPALGWFCGGHSGNDAVLTACNPAREGGVQPGGGLEAWRARR